MKFSNLALSALFISNNNRGPVEAFAPFALTAPRNPLLSVMRATVSSSSSSSSSTPSVSDSSSSYEWNNADLKKNVVSFGTIHREEVDLDSMSDDELLKMQKELEAINESCTEDGTQTNPECDVELKDERDRAIVQIQAVLTERNPIEPSHDVRMKAIRELVRRPWTHDMSVVTAAIESMERVNCECTEEGNQTNPACDVALKDERDAAIETLKTYVSSVQTYAKKEAGLGGSISSRSPGKMPQRDERSLCARVESPPSPQLASFDMGEIRDAAVVRPGTKSVEVMATMVKYLEAQQEACTEECTQTNPECDVEIKAERDTLLEALSKQINEAKIAARKIKSVVDGLTDHSVAMEDVANAVFETIPLPVSSPVAQAIRVSNNTDAEYLVMI